MSSNWIDISMKLSPETPSWPGDPLFELTPFSQIKDGDPANISHLSMCAHAGTHVDAPLHYLQNGVDISQMPLETMIGPCHVFETDEPVITDEVLHHLGIVEAERVLFKTRNSRRHLATKQEFQSDYVYLAPSGARYLANHHIRCVGIDALSVGGMSDGDETHRILLSSGIWVIEGLDLRALRFGDYELVCLPLRIIDADGSPARAIVRRLGEGIDEPVGGNNTVDDAIEFASRMG